MGAFISTTPIIASARATSRKGTRPPEGGLSAAVTGAVGLSFTWASQGVRITPASPSEHPAHIDPSTDRPEPGLVLSAEGVRPRPV
ncbi:hypothetical protein GCM10026982_03460 [Nocardiopsis aegyptia]